MQCMSATAISTGSRAAIVSMMVANASPSEVRSPAPAVELTVVVMVRSSGKTAAGQLSAHIVGSVDAAERARRPLPPPKPLPKACDHALSCEARMLANRSERHA
eukprot:TRINITY_DN36651_c0_g1_i1.p2 TRINITY_DN36651_c0_g1~~TRINITY_DN36651_c0_g1_i1.p2  ORF type:complete len:104 (+),score=23.17 TRINITY_DN36651_c0_g1_i1:298-609(+)